MNRYETIYVYSPEFPAEKAANLMERIKSTITKDGGEIAAVNEWGKKPLAYRIAGNSEGVYVLVEHVSSGKTVSELENIFRITEGVLRYLTVIKKIIKEVPVEKKDVQPAAAAATASPAPAAVAPVPEPQSKEPTNPA